MTEIDAVKGDSCPACGGKARWNPERQALICPYCGTQAPGEVDTETGKITEIDLVTALRDLPDELRGWQTEKRSVRCRSCQAVSVFDAERVGQNCEFCGSPELVDYEEIKSPLRPQSLLPFKVDESRVRESIRKWYGGKWLAPGKLKTRAMLDTVHGVYLPYWTFDAEVACDWVADSGTYYTTTERVRDAQGRVRNRRVQKVRWRPASGHLTHFFDDEPIPGTRGVHPGLLRDLEPFPTTDLVPYDTAFLSGFVVEHYQVVLIDAARSAREAMIEKLRDLCGREVPGDTHRNLRIDPRFSQETFKHILVPVWLLSYRYGSKAYQIAVNGYTGQIAGEYPKSMIKLVVLWLVIALIVLAVVFLARS